MKKYAVRLDPMLVERLRREARRRSSEFDRDVTWVDLLRQAADRVLAGPPELDVPPRAPGNEAR